MNRLSLAVLGLIACAVVPHAQDRPLPELAPFVREVRARLETDGARQQPYSYMETQRKTTFDGSGRARSESVTVTESYPGFPGESRWERVLQRDGVPVPEAELRQKDAERQREAERYARKMATQTAADRARQEREWEKDRRERAQLVDDVFVVYDIVMRGRERIEGHDTIAFTLTPRPRSRPQTRDGRFMKSFIARAWVSETDYELARLDVEATENVSMGMGLLARVHKGATASFIRRKVNGEAWLPARAEYRVSARILLLKAFREGGISEFSNYRKFSVDTSTAISAPQ
jgi:hypothetical protein